LFDVLDVKGESFLWGHMVEMVGVTWPTGEPGEREAAILQSFDTTNTVVVHPQNK
jgi:hypothetical protein